MSTGELTLAFDMLGRLTRQIEPHGIVSELSAEATRWRGVTPHTYAPAGGREAVTQIQGHLDALEPDVVLIADLLLAYVSSPEFGRFFRRGPNLLPPLLAPLLSRCPVMALDLYDWDLNGNAVDLLGTDASRFVPKAPQGIGRLMPTPYLRPGPSSPGRGAYPMMADTGGRSEAARRAAREGLGLGAEKVVLMLTSPWQHLFAGDPRAAQMTHEAPKFLFSMLTQAAGGEKLKVIHLGPAPFTDGLTTLEYQHVPQMPPNQFQQLLDGCDLVYSANCIATSNIRAATKRLPVATVHFPSGDPAVGHGASHEALKTFLEATPTRYPSSVWPLGMHTLMQTIYEDNPFRNIQLNLDAFRPDEAVAQLGALLHDARARRDLRQSQDEYFGRLATMDSAEDAFTHALGADALVQR